LFGGEPTCRDDLFELIDIGHSCGLTLFINTNGLKLADEDYCRRLCDKGVSILLGFDGRHPEIHEKMRKNPNACEKKVQALDNIPRRFYAWTPCCYCRRASVAFHRPIDRA